MIAFNDEIKRYKPILEMNDIEKSTRDDEVADVLELLQYIAAKKDLGAKSPESPATHTKE